MRVMMLLPVAAVSIIACPHTQVAADRVRWTKIGTDDGVVTVDQTTRVGFKRGNKFCVEPVGPVAYLQDFSTDGRLGGGLNTNTGVNVVAGVQAPTWTLDAGVSVNYAFAAQIEAEGRARYFESLAHAYEVDSMMQLVNTISYRYCEAWANSSDNPGASQNPAFKSLEAMLKDVSRLIILQMAMKTDTDLIKVAEALDRLSRVKSAAFDDCILKAKTEAEKTFCRSVSSDPDGALDPDAKNFSPALREAADRLRGIEKGRKSLQSRISSTQTQYNSIKLETLQ